MFSNRAKNDDARMERKKSERHRAGCPPLLFLSILLSVSHLFDLRQPKAESRVDPLQELVASHEVGAVRGRGHRVMMFFFFRRRRRRRRSRRRMEKRKVLPFLVFEACSRALRR